MNQVTVKRVSTEEQLISQRTIGYQIFVNDEYLITCTDVNDVDGHEGQTGEATAGLGQNKLTPLGHKLARQK
jgi:hypothetical protein